MRKTVSSVRAVPRSPSRFPSTVWWTVSPSRASRTWAQGMRPGPTYLSARMRSIYTKRTTKKPELLMRLIWFFGVLLRRTAISPCLPLGRKRDDGRKETPMQTVSTEIRGRTLVVTIERPQARNAVDGPTARQLYDAFRAFDADEALDG